MSKRHSGPINLTTVFRRHAQVLGHAEAVMDAGSQVRYSWREFDARIDAAAGVLRELGVGRGDIVAILLFNRFEFLEVAFGANRLGAVFLPLNWRLAGDEFRYILDHAGAKALVSEPNFYAVVEGIRAQLSSLTTFISTGNEAAPPGWVSYAEAMAAQEAIGERIEDAATGEDDLHRLMYTSGTTARPKGVQITYGNVLWKNLSHIVEFGLTNQDRTLIVGPMYHVGALDLPTTGVLHAGGSVVILPKFDVTHVLDVIEGERPTNMWLAPSMVNLLLQRDDLLQRDLRSVRLIIDGGEKMPVGLVQRLLDSFPEARFADAYGLTETVSGDTFLDKRSTIEKLGSVGKPVVHLELRIIDSDGTPVGPGIEGEIQLRGPKVFPGYWRDPDATSAAIDDDGWFHTGDIGRRDEDGFLYIVDRMKDVIISGGENIASLDVEHVLQSNTDVLECAVVGRPDPQWGEVPIAFVVLRPGVHSTKEQILGSCAGRLAKFKIPKDVVFVDALPRNPSGKVLKRDLRGRLATPSL